MPNRTQLICALRPKLQPCITTAPQRPILSEGLTYRMELNASQEFTSAKLLRIVDDAPLGRGFSFQLPDRKIFIYEYDLQPSDPRGVLMVTVPL